MTDSSFQRLNFNKKILLNFFDKTYKTHVSNLMHFQDEMAQFLYFKKGTREEIITYYNINAYMKSAKLHIKLSCFIKKHLGDIIL